MSSFEWMELQTLARDISASRARLATARSQKDAHLVRSLEDEITTAEKRRAQLLSHITDDLASEALPEPSRPSETVERTDIADVWLAPEADASPMTSSAGEAANAWEQLTPADIERALNDIETRRADTLARHAAELNALSADQAELDNLEEAIEAFTRRFNFSALTAAVVALDEERGRRQHG